MAHDRSLASPQFPGDDGSVDVTLAAAFGDDVAVLQALPAARVFVPIVALLGEVPAAGDKNADMAAVLMTGADGRQALLAFSSVAAMAVWDPQARPVPVLGKDAALATLDVYEETGAFANAASLAPVFERELHALRPRPHVIDVRNIGLVGGVELAPRGGGQGGQPGARGMEAFHRAHDAGLLIRVTGDIIALSPPLIIEEEHIAEFAHVLRKVLHETA